jgi:hypothetical protein
LAFLNLNEQHFKDLEEADQALNASQIFTLGWSSESWYRAHLGVSCAVKKPKVTSSKDRKAGDSRRAYTIPDAVAIARQFLTPAEFGGFKVDNDRDIDPQHTAAFEGLGFSDTVEDIAGVTLDNINDFMKEFGAQDTDIANMQRQTTDQLDSLPPLSKSDAVIAMEAVGKRAYIVYDSLIHEAEQDDTPPELPLVFSSFSKERRRLLNSWQGPIRQACRSSLTPEIEFMIKPRLEMFVKQSALCRHLRHHTQTPAVIFMLRRGTQTHGRTPISVYFHTKSLVSLKPNRD